MHTYDAHTCVYMYVQRYVYNMWAHKSCTYTCVCVSVSVCLCVYMYMHIAYVQMCAYMRTHVCNYVYACL